MGDSGGTRWWILGGVAVAAAIGIGVLLAGEDEVPPRTPGGANDPIVGAAGAEGAEGGAPGEVQVRVRGAAGAAFDGDGGVAPVGSRITPRVAGAIDQGRVRERAIVRRQALPDDADRTAGWRLGRTRRRVALLESRIEQLGANVDRLRAAGQDDLAARQESVVERTRTRLGELREEETELAAAAQADGTMGDAAEGFGDDPLVPDAPTARATLPTGAP